MSVVFIYRLTIRHTPGLKFYYGMVYGCPVGNFYRLYFLELLASFCFVSNLHYLDTFNILRYNAFILTEIKRIKNCYLVSHSKN